jgi:hypothetical protein
MCRSIKTLRGAEPPATDGDIRAASLQFVRKISGYRKPSAANTAVFEAAVDDIARASQKLLNELTTGRAAHVQTHNGKSPAVVHAH